MVLEARNATLSLGGARIVHRVSLTVERGQLLALCGPNGAGKSTLLAGLAGDLAPVEGEILLDGTPVSDIPVARLAGLRAVLEQAPVLSAPFTVAELAGMGVPPEVSPAEAAGRVASALRLAGLADRAGMRVDRLSAGQRQRAHLARVLAQVGREGRLLFLDEPTSSLDLAHQVSVLRACRDVARAGVAVVAVLHDLNLAAAFADRVALMEAGRLVAEGPPARVLTGPALSGLYGTPIEAERDAAGHLRILPIYQESASRHAPT